MTWRTWDYEKIKQYGDFKPTDAVLETGAMFGMFSVFIAPLVNTIIATDSYGWANRQGMEQTADEWAEEVLVKDNIFIGTEDMQRLSFESNYFDKVVSVSAIEHVNDDRLALEEMMRVLRPGGRLLFTTEYNPYHNYRVDDIDGSFYRVYDTPHLMELIKGYNLLMWEVLDIQQQPFTTILIVLEK